MSIHYEDLIEESLAKFFKGDKFETRDDFIDALDRFEDEFTERIGGVVDRFAELTAEELNDLNIAIEAELEEDNNEPTAREEAMRDLQAATVAAVRGGY